MPHQDHGDEEALLLCAKQSVGWRQGMPFYKNLSCFLAKNRAHEPPPYAHGTSGVLEESPVGTPPKEEEAGGGPETLFPHTGAMAVLE